MNTLERLKRSINLFYPEQYKSIIREMLVYTGSKTTITEYLSNSFFIGFMISFITFTIFLMLDINIWLVLLYTLTSFFGIQILFYVLLYMKSESIKEDIENNLPDALQVMASNLDAGSTPYQGMKAAVKKEFGMLGRLFDSAIKKVIASENFNDALNDISKKTNSKVFKRAVKLINSAMKTGGNLAPILREIAQDISERKMLKDEMITNTKTYTMFIMFTIIVGAPLLFSISIHFVTIVNGLQATTDTTANEFGLGLMAGGTDIGPEFLTKISYISLFFISLFACGMMGVITKGKVKLGLKYAPIIIGGSILVFIISKGLISSMFGGLS